MLKLEKNYDFRKRMLEIHKKDIRDFSFKPDENMYEVKDDLTVYIPDKSPVILNAAHDFVDYLFISMGISAIIKVGNGKNENKLKLVLSLAGEDKDLGEAKGYRGFEINTTPDGIFVYGNDDRGIAQAVYYIEELMTLNRAPFVSYGTIRKKPLYSPQMVHSGYGLDEYPNEYLASVAHAGRDAILVFTKDVDITPYGYLDFNELIYRASKYGIDVYAYSYLKSDLHPDDPAAEEYYESNYGKLFRKCPGLKGVTLVGESVSIPSEDPHVTGRKHNKDDVVDGIPTGKYPSEWYPCCDYPKWLNLLKKIVRKYNPEADIVFWTYNWGFQPEDIRVKLIESLPTDISLQATFEMFQKLHIGEIEFESADYSLAPAGYGGYFKSEAEAAKKRGIRLYSMTNTGGLTWDMGVIPYEPFPHQWIERFKAMNEARNKWGLCGLMECHHYGMYPSFISTLSKWIFMEPDPDYDKILLDVLRIEFGKENVTEIESALKLWSKAITHYTPTNADQYGAFRVGPSYPFCLEREIKLPDVPYCLFGNRICYVSYIEQYYSRGATLPGIRILKEIDSLKKMQENIEKGLEILKAIQNPNDELLYLINLGEFILRTVITGINAKKWHLYKCNLKSANDKDVLKEIIDNMEKLLKEERLNAESAIPFVQKDSRLGWEPSMEYMTDEEHIRWKLRQIDFVINTEIKGCKDSLRFS